MALALVLALAGCSPSFAVADAAQLSCSQTEACPSGWVCNQNVSRCVKVNGLDTVAPSLTSPATPSPGIVRRGATTTLAFDVSEPLLGPPTAQLQTAPTRPLAFDSAASTDTHFVLTYQAEGDEPTGADVPITLQFTDRSGNIASATTSVRFDFQPPDANAISITGSSLRAGGVLRVGFTATEQLSGTPQVELGQGTFLVADPTVAPPNYAFEYVATGSEPEGPVALTLQLTDLAGNSASIPLGNAATLDFSPPALQRAPEVLTPAVRESFTALVRFSVTEPLAQAPAVTLDPGDGGTALPLSVATLVGNEYTFERRVVSGDPDGTYTVRLGALEDLAHNLTAAQPLGTLAIDKQAPGVLGSISLDKVNPRYKAGDVVSLSFDSTEPLGPSPKVELDLPPPLGPQPFACITTAAHSDCSLTVDGGEPEGPAGITVELQDPAGNVGFGTTSLVLDFTPPFAVGAGIQLLPGAGNLQQQVTAVASGTQVVATFGLSEPIVGTPTVTTTTPAAIPFASLGGPGNAFAFVCDGGQPQGTYDLTVTATDVAGNVGTSTLSASAFTVDETPPGAPNVVAANQIIYHRNPFGSTATAGAPQDWLELASGSVPVDATVVVYDAPTPGSRRELGRTTPPPGQAVTSVALDPIDRPTVYALSLDAAGNATSALEVKEIEWIASLGGKQQGSTYENPSTLMVAPLALPFIDHGVAGATEPSTAQLATLVKNDAAGFSQPSLALWRQQTFDGLAPTRRTLSAMALDPVRGKLVLFGAGEAAQLPANDTWELDLATHDWTQRVPSSGAPPARWGHVLAADGSGLAYLFGGNSGSSASTLLNDVWTWDGNAGVWAKVTTTGSAPAPRERAQAAIDPVRQKLVVFGGDSGSAPLADLWELDLVTHAWTNRTPGTLPPSWPAGHSGGLLAYDPSRSILILTGYSPSGADTWELSPGTATWTSRGAAPFTNTPGLQGAFDRQRDALFVLDPGNGGATASHVFRYDPGTPAWTDVSPSPLPAEWPAAHNGAAAAEDPLHGGVVFFGGHDVTGFGNAQTWLLSSASQTFVSWTSTTVAPPDLWGSAAAFDSIRGRWMVFGGRTVGGDSNQLWEYDPGAGTWLNRTPSTLPPNWPLSRVGAGMAFDSRLGQLLLFGGSVTGTASNTLYRIDPVNLTSTVMTFSGVTPSARMHPVVAFNPVPSPGKLYLLGGSDALGSTTGVGEFTGCTFDASSTATCSALTISGGPTTFSELAGAVGVDSTTGQGKLVVFGGQPSSGPQSNRVFEFNGSTWSAPTVRSTWPTARSRAALAFNPARNKFVLFGGYDATAGALLNDLWEYGNGIFTPVSTGSATPAGRAHAAIGFSLVDDALMLFGGALGTDRSVPPAAGDTWTMQLPALGTPAAVWTVPFSAASAPTGSLIRQVSFSLSAAGTGTGPSGSAQAGAAASIWHYGYGSWVQVATNGSPILGPSLLTGSFTDPTSTGAMFGGAQRTLGFQLTPLGRNRTGSSLANLLLDNLELTIRYRRP
jgi:hypothetical protein